MPNSQSLFSVSAKPIKFLFHHRLEPRRPPPRLAPADVSEEQLRATGDDWPLNATQEELNEAMSHDPTVAHETGGSGIDASKNSEHGKKGARSWASLREVLGLLYKLLSAPTCSKQKLAQRPQRTGLVLYQSLVKIYHPVLSSSNHGIMDKRDMCTSPLKQPFPTWPSGLIQQLKR